MIVLDAAPINLSQSLRELFSVSAVVRSCIVLSVTQSDERGSNLLTITQASELMCVHKNTHGL